MHKTLEAWLRGYVVFYVNDDRYWLYHRALIKAHDMGNVTLQGWHVFKGWRMFLMRWTRTPPGYTADAWYFAEPTQEQFKCQSKRRLPRYHSPY